MESSKGGKRANNTMYELYDLAVHYVVLHNTMSEARTSPKEGNLKINNTESVPIRYCGIYNRQTPIRIQAIQWRQGLSKKVALRGLQKIVTIELL